MFKTRCSYVPTGDTATVIGRNSSTSTYFVRQSCSLLTDRLHILVIIGNDDDPIKFTEDLRLNIRLVVAGGAHTHRSKTSALLLNPIHLSKIEILIVTTSFSRTFTVLGQNSEK